MFTDTLVVTLSMPEKTDPMFGLVWSGPRQNFSILLCIWLSSKTSAKKTLSMLAAMPVQSSLVDLLVAGCCLLIPGV